MKIGILTFHNVYNYGAILQAYALQKKVKEITKKDVEIIDYTNDFMKSKSPKNIFEVIGYKDKIKYLIMRNSNKKIRKQFKEFCIKYMKISQMSYNRNNIHEANKEYDSFIVGSDQVWNNKLNGNDNTYFLDFVEKGKKISYAASFGFNRASKEYKEKYSSLIKQMDNISVREIDGISIVEDITNKEAKLVLDPTFLLTKNEWEEICIKPKIKKDYILVYIVTLTPNIINYAKELARQENCEIICIHRSYKNYKDVKNIKDASIQEFMGYLKYAKYVLTTSYHGLILSLNLNKKVYFELADSKINYNSRLKTIIDIFKIEKQEIKNNTLITEEIDYSNINKIINEKRNESIEFIKKI